MYSGYKISITLWGDGKVKGNWLEWYRDMSIIFDKLGHKRTHLDMESHTWSKDYIVTVARKEKEILHKLHNGETPKQMSCFSLPPNYHNTVRHNLMARRTEEYVTLIMEEEDFYKIDVDETIECLKKYIDYTEGEIYKTDKQQGFTV